MRHSADPVSYTHLDVYKRQRINCRDDCLVDLVDSFEWYRAWQSATEKRAIAILFYHLPDVVINGVMGSDVDRDREVVL